MAHGPRKKPLYFYVNSDHVTLGLRLSGAKRYRATLVCFTPHLININNFEGFTCYTECHSIVLLLLIIIIVIYTFIQRSW